MKLQKSLLVLAVGVLSSLTLFGITAGASTYNSDFIEEFKFASVPITYRYDNSITKQDKAAYEYAVNQWELALGRDDIFTYDSSSPVVTIKSSNSYGDYWTRDDGSISSINAITTSTYNTTTKLAIKAVIINYDKSMKKMGTSSTKWKRIIAEHELGHLLGLGELDNGETDVMSRYFYSKPNQKITPLDIETVKSINKF